MSWLYNSPEMDTLIELGRLYPLKYMQVQVQKLPQIIKDQMKDV
jgi:hypothetical protein